MKKCNRETMIKILKEISESSKEIEPSQKEKEVIKTLTRKDIENEYLERRRKKDID